MIDPKYILEHFEEIQERIRWRDPCIDLSKIRGNYTKKKDFKLN